MHTNKLLYSHRDSQLNFLLTLLLLCSLSVSASDIENPILGAQEIISITERYLVDEQKIVIDEYERTKIVFTDSTKYDYGNKWHLIYKKAAQTNNGIKIHRTDWFRVTLSNKEKPEIKFVQGY